MSETPVEPNESDFVLKHRIVGAAFLLFFGALVLPWLLGPTSNAEVDDNDSLVVVEVQNDVISKDLESEILAELKESLEGDEQVYISKITPEGKVSHIVSAKSEAEMRAEKERQAQEQAKSKEAEKRRLAKANEAKKVKAKEVAEKRQAEQAAKEKAEDDVLAQKKAELAKRAQEAKRLTQKDEAQKKARNDSQLEVVTQTTSKAVSLQSSSSQAEADLAAALEAESKANSDVITKGWVVQVGMFVDKKKALGVFDQLTEKGFKPSTSTVDTNLGLATGTRVWLGPFRERQGANDMKEQLAKKTGTSGFIRAYP